MLALTIPLAAAALVAGLAYSGAFDSHHSEDWGPLLAILFAAGLAMATSALAVIAAVIGLIGLRQRNKTDMSANKGTDSQ